MRKNERLRESWWAVLSPKPYGEEGRGSAHWTSVGPLRKLDMNPWNLIEARPISELGLSSLKAGGCGLQTHLGQEGEETPPGVHCPVELVPVFPAGQMWHQASGARGTGHQDRGNPGRVGCCRAASRTELEVSSQGRLPSSSRTLQSGEPCGRETTIARKES